MALWPNSVFAVPVSSFMSPVPVPGVDPLTGDCRILRVNAAWLPYIAGALQQLILQTTWQGDAAAVANAQAQAMNLILALADAPPGGCEPDQPCPPIDESEYQMSICEQLEFRGGVLYGLCCGVWTPIDGQGPTGVPSSPPQPGAGSGLPPSGGGQKEYCGQLGRGTWLLPTQVNSGDQLLFADLFGAWQDNRDLFWHCPDGFLFVLDVCGPTLPHGSPDPLPTGYHMQLIAEINGTFYDCLQTDSQGNPSPFTVPSGITNANVTIQANIDDTDLINGSVQFCVTVTNNQLPGWSLDQDFALNPGGWATDIPGTSGTQSQWLPVSGWNSIDCDDMLSGSGRYNVVFIRKVFATPTTLQHFDLTFDAVVGDLADSGVQLVNAKQGATDNTIITATPVTGDNQFLGWNGSLAGVTEIIVLLYGADRNDTTCPPTGSATLHHVHMSGVGVSP